MRKTLRTALGTALGTVLVSATMAVSATPAFANDCATAAPLGTKAQTGTLDALTPEMWWTHTIDADHRVVSLATRAGSATLEVRDVDCSTVLCTDRASAADTATCTLDRTGPVTIGVIGDATGIVFDGPWTFEYVLDGFGFVPACRDHEDNDFDGTVDWPHDAQCTSADDNTESPMQVAAYGTITIETDANGSPKMALKGIFAPQVKKFTCRFEPSLIQVTCVQVDDTEFLYMCQHVILTASAFSTSRPLGPGAAKGYVACDEEGASLTTEEVDSRYNLKQVSDTTDNYTENVYLGSAGFVRCRALGVKGEPNPAQNYTVDCGDPGVAWPVDTVADPRG